jgi:hypothetical protein
MRNKVEIKSKIIEAGYAAVDELIEVARDKIISNDENDLSSDKLKNAAATKKLALFDAFEILSRLQSEEEAIEMERKGISYEDSKQGFAERRADKNNK